MMLEQDFAIWIVLLVAGSLILLIVVPTLWSGAPPTPSGRAVRTCVLETLLEQELPDGRLYDLGSGWGGMARALAARFPDREVIGIEISFLPWLISWAGQRLFGPKNLHFRYGDFRKQPLKEAAVLVCYLGPGLSQQAVSAIKSGQTPSCYAVSCFFVLPGLTLVGQRTARDLYRTPVYIYQV